MRDPAVHSFWIHLDGVAVVNERSADRPSFIPLAAAVLLVLLVTISLGTFA